MIATARTAQHIALLTCLAFLAACGREQAGDAGSARDPDRQAQSALGGVVKRATDEARKKLATENIRISDGLHINVNGTTLRRQDVRPKAEITPQGTLLIDGRAVEATPAQTALLLDYRSRIIAIAETGMDIGVQGADLAAKAMGEAVKGAFSGKSGADIERSIEAEAEGIQRAATQLCDRLPALLSSQRRLAAALPEFVPYATMDESDIDDCMENRNGATRDERRAHRREEIRSGIRSSIRRAVQSGGLATRDATAAPAEGRTGEAPTTE